MARVELESLTKVYPNGVQAVSELTLDVAEGELMVLVGPSGCGKTTALRMVAGLESVSSGTIRFGERIVNDLSPRDRDVAMVFQNYALYPHMTVGENIAFSLRLKKADRSEVRSKVEEAARVLGLTEYLDRRPAQLSGGQRQRVAMGRALVREPSVFLMDEPLSNLDAKLRVQMRTEIGRIQRRLGVATFYVTHDQTEAMTLGDRVAVMRAGHLEQCDLSQVVYDRPASIFVASFIGSPPMNLYRAQIGHDGHSLRLGSQDLALGPADRAGVTGRPGGEVVVGFRPENLRLAGSGSTGAGREGAAGGGPGGAAAGGGSVRLAAQVEVVESLGADKLVHFLIDAERVMDTEAMAATEGSGAAEHLTRGEVGMAASSLGIARLPADAAVRVGERVELEMETAGLAFFDPETGTALSRLEPDRA
jgi:multiple sugar transport system ATP-binding protein